MDDFTPAQRAEIRRRVYMLATSAIDEAHFPDPNRTKTRKLARFLLSHRDEWPVYLSDAVGEMVK